MCVYMYGCVYVCVFICMCVCVYVCAWCVCLYTCVYVYVYLYVCMCVYACVHVCMSVCLSVCMLSVCIFVCYPNQQTYKTVKSNSSKKEGNVLFNDALNICYLRFYGVRHMVKCHTYNEREETRFRHMGYSFRLTARVLLYAPSHIQDSTYHGLWYTSREHWLEREIAQWVHDGGSIRRPIAP